jgi:molybdopterin-binding protein
MSISAINVRNQFKGKVKEIIRGPVVSEVDVDTPFGIVTSVITTRSVDELDLQGRLGSGRAGEVDGGVDRAALRPRSFECARQG